MNFSSNNLTFVAPVKDAPSLHEVIKDFCTQMDGNFLILIMLIYSYFVLRLIINRMEELLKEFEMDGFLMFTDAVFDIVNSLGLLSVGFLMVYAYYQSPPTWFIVWSVTLLCLAGLVRLSAFKSWLDNDGLRKLSRKLKTWREKMKDND